MNFQEKLGRYEYAIWEAEESIITCKEEIEEYRNEGKYDSPSCAFLRGKLVVHREVLHTLTGDESVFKADETLTKEKLQELIDYVHNDGFELANKKLK